MKHLFQSSSRGSTLLISLWALMLLSAVVFAWAKWVHHRLDLHREEALGLEAYSLALNGLTLAQHPNVLPGSSLLEVDLGSERSYSATVIGEGGKLNLIHLLASEDVMRRTFFNDYLAFHGLTLEEREAFIDGVLDWMDADSLKRNRGAEEDGDYMPTNQMLTTLEDLPRIRGTAPLIAAHPDWREDFTLYSTGPLDLKAAPAELIALLPGVSEDAAKAYVQVRRGSDGIDGTADDGAIANAQAALAQLGIVSQEQMRAVAPLVSFNDSTIRIRSTGRAGSVSRQIEVVARKLNDSPTPTILIRIEP